MLPIAPTSSPTIGNTLVEPNPAKPETFVIYRLFLIAQKCILFDFQIVKSKNGATLYPKSAPGAVNRE